MWSMFVCGGWRKADYSKLQFDHGMLSVFILQLVQGQEPELLIMAGGGGGLNYASFPDTDNETGWSFCFEPIDLKPPAD